MFSQFGQDLAHAGVSVESGLLKRPNGRAGQVNRRPLHVVSGGTECLGCPAAGAELMEALVHV